MAKPIPDGFTPVTPYLIVPDVEREIAFLRHAVAAVEVMTMPGPGGRVFHAEVHVAGGRIMLGRSSDKHPPLPAMIYLYVPDVDAAFGRAAGVEGVTVAMPVTDEFYGDRIGSVVSAGGVTYCIATHTEDLTPEQIGQRMAERMAKK